MTRLLAIAVLLTQIAVAGAQEAVITGHIRGGDGKPAAGVRVAVAERAADGKVGSDTVLVRITKTDNAGFYRLEDVPPGSYAILAGSLTSPVYFPGKSDPKAAGLVTVSSGQRITAMDFSLTPASTRKVTPLKGMSLLTTLSGPERIEGYVAVEGGTPPPAGLALVVSTVGLPQPKDEIVPLPDTGIFYVSLLPNMEYKVALSLAHHSASYAVKTVIFGNANLEGRTFSIDGPTARTLRITLENGPRLVNP